MVLCPETSFLIHTSEGLLSAPPQNLPGPLVQVALTVLKPLDASRPLLLLLLLPRLASFRAVWSPLQAPFPSGLPVNPTPPHLITQGPLPDFCPEQQTHLPQGFVFLTPRCSLLTALGPESRQWPPGQALRVHADHETAPSVPRPLHLPVKGSDRAAAGPSTFITLGEALCLFKGD